MLGTLLVATSVSLTIGLGLLVAKGLIALALSLLAPASSLAGRGTEVA